AYEAARTDANQRFQGAGRPGADTDCGRVFILLGAPDEVMAGTEPGGRKLESAKLAREAQTWTYRDRPGMKFKDGKVQIAFDESCMLPQGARFGEQLNAVAASKIVNPNLDYRKTADGHVVKLEEQLPKPTPIMALLKQPRQDFAAEVEQSVVMRSADGATYVAGLVRVDPALLSTDGQAATAVVGVQAVADGKTAASTEREMRVELAPGAKAVHYSWGLALRPGDYELRVGVLDPKTGKGSATVQKVSAPDFGAEQFSMSPLVLLEDIEQGPAGPQHHLSAFQFGDMRMKPRFGNVYAPADAVTLIAFVYAAQMPPAADPATPAKPSLTATFTVLK
ncbi:MAG TPA: GWxTD domain-containing protein, partial [Vicinamibacteria bacterium]|nr:GWxTD domain-containing protein [Vicinamibacteria bacterium]